MTDINCPYCDAGLEINHDDGFGYEENMKHEMMCSECRKYFVFTTSISFNYDAEQADCLNGKACEYGITHTSPKEFSMMECSICGTKRELTDDERTSYNLGTKQDYFKSLENPY